MFERKERIMSMPVYEQGCFVDDEGVVRDVANPGHGQACKVEGGIVLLCEPGEDGHFGEVLGEFTYYPTLDALRAIGYKPNVDGKAVSV
jgi:hypothetical protein